MQLVAVTIYFTTNGAFEMLELSSQYHAGGSYAENMVLQSAGKTLLLNWQGSAFSISYIFGCLAILTISYVMMQSHVFSRLDAYFGILAAVLMVIPPSAGMFGMDIPFFFLLPAIPWLLLLALKLFQLHRKL